MASCFALLLEIAAVTAQATEGNAPAAQESTLESADEIIYTVVPGDTLFEIAERFGISLESLVTYNQITDPNLLEVGQQLRIPPATVDPDPALLTANTPTRVAFARPGDTVATLVRRLAQDIAIVSALNDMAANQRLFPGQPILVPATTPTPHQPVLGAITEVRFPPPLIQGRTQWLWLTTNRPLTISANWNGLPIPLTPVDSLGLRQFALLPVPALLEPGLYPITIMYVARNGHTLSRTWSLQVNAGSYDSQEINLPPDRGSLLDPTIIQAEFQIVMDVWDDTSSTLLWTQTFTRPIASEYATTSPFGTRRSYNGGPYSSYHEGQDFGVPAGVPVAAPARGIVALAESLEVRGNAVILDHGRGIFTGYWHLSEIAVVPGQEVRMGDPLGLSGNTGLSTGAHLHWELRIYTIAVDPMQFLAEPLLADPLTPGVNFPIQSADP